MTIHLSVFVSILNYNDTPGRNKSFSKIIPLDVSLMGLGEETFLINKSDFKEFYWS